MSLRSFLRHWRILNPFDFGDVDKAETDNALRDHSTAMSRLEAAGNGIREAQGKLRASIQYAKSSSDAAQRQPDAMAQFVHDMRSHGQHQQRH